jgi:sugar phosphate permease
LITHWFSPSEIGRAWGVWNASHQIGGGVIVLAGGYLIAHYGWRSAFWVPGLVCVLGAIWIMAILRDSPESMGLPSVEVHSGEAKPHQASEIPFWVVFRTHILGNPWVWVVSVANFFVYTVRSGILDWAPKYLMESKGLTISQTSYAVSAFEFAGIFGAFGAGWMSDKIFKGRRGPVSVGYMLLLTGFLWILFSIPKGSGGTLTLVFSALGFLVYGPQLLVAVAAADFATKAAASSAVGLTGLFGYLGASFCSFATGYLVDRFGWDGAIWLYVGSAVVGGLLLVSTWSRRPTVVIHAD